MLDKQPHYENPIFHEHVHHHVIMTYAHHHADVAHYHEGRKTHHAFVDESRLGDDRSCAQT